jgi:hypothetical protein
MWKMEIHKELQSEKNIPERDDLAEVSGISLWKKWGVFFMSICHVKLKMYC